MTDALSTLVAIAAFATLCLCLWAGAQLIAHYRWRRFLKLLDERIGPSPLCNGRDLRTERLAGEYLHSSTIGTGAQRDHA